MRGGGKTIVPGLAGIDMIAGMHRMFRAERSAEDFIGASGIETASFDFTGGRGGAGVTLRHRAQGAGRWRPPHQSPANRHHARIPIRT